MKVRALHDKAKKLWHVPMGYRFNDEGISDWPDDQFTKRRIRDGDIEVVEEQKSEGEQEGVRGERGQSGQEVEPRRRARAEHKVEGEQEGERGPR